MKVSELIEHLKQFDGDLEVYAVCDHGQAPEKVSPPSEFWVEETCHTLYDDFTCYEEEAEECGYTIKAILL